MMKIIDEITGEVITIDDYMSAYKDAKSRVKFHNSEFTYANGSKHLPQDAELIDNGDGLVIKRREHNGK